MKVLGDNKLMKWIYTGGRWLGEMLIFIIVRPRVKSGKLHVYSHATRCTNKNTRAL